MYEELVILYMVAGEFSDILNSTFFINYLCNWCILWSVSYYLELCVWKHMNKIIKIIIFISNKMWIVIVIVTIMRIVCSWYIWLLLHFLISVYMYYTESLATKHVSERNIDYG